ncbi:MAG: U32 family peptidase [Firmicutes bacterium]|nr:U32 family peptidase [Bacillota bacterium]
MNNIEVLSPAGNLEKLKIAYLYGADAVYVGGKDFSLRSKAGNFDLEQLKEAKKISVELNKKLYIALNIFAHNDDLKYIIDYLEQLDEIRLDAMIVSDPGIIYLAKKHAPNTPIHLSTQSNTLNWAGCQFWLEQGLERVVLGREVSLKEIANIHKNTEVELEAFVHGAMCMAYSGRCMLSMYMTGKSANSGSCTHPCRWEYYVVEKQRSDQFMPIEEDERGTYIFNSKDLCMLPYLDRFIKDGITSLKIEGRMKSIHYVATVTKVYREAVDIIKAGGDFESAIPKFMSELNGIGERDYTTGFYLDEKDEKMQQYEPFNVEKNIKFVGKVLEVLENEILIEQRNKFIIGDTLEVLLPIGENLNINISSIVNELGESVDSAPHPKEKLLINKIPGVVAGSLLRIRS